MVSTYRKYFDIKKQYYPCVTDELISKGGVDWKDFYPHPTFINLIETTADVIERKQPLGIWVEGGYGTGKSYAALTLSNLLNADRKTTEAYFDRYNLDKTLQKRFCAMKERKDDSGNVKKIVTVHCYGTSSIDGDADLCSIMQESIIKELKDAGCIYMGQTTLKEASLKWLSIPRNKAYFESILAADNSFIGQTADDVIKGLQTYSGESLSMLMGKIAKLGKENGVDPMKLDVKIFIKWLKDVIQGNNLQELFFIWDEFTKYFQNHIHDLTGFQEIMEVTETNNFCLLVVTHSSVSEGIVNDGKSEKKIMDRFVKPTCVIDLPENIAFKLIGHALEKNTDEQIAQEWKEICETQFFDTAVSRKMIEGKLKVLTSDDISDEDMMSILPIHPYAALILKYIASSFQENTRSMFAYIKNNLGTKLKDFQWYIDNYGPYTANPFVTIDMLWEYFYQDEGRYLRQDIRNILSSISKAKSYKLDDEQTKILKTVLLMQAISYMNGDAVDCFYATEKNLNLAFEGTIIGNSAASIADSLRKMNILFSKIIQGQTVYIVQLIATTTIKKEDVEAKWPTSKLIANEKFSDPLSMPGALKLRFSFMSATHDTIVSCINKLKKQAYRKGIFDCICVYSKNDAESHTIASEIDKCLKESKNDDLNLTIIDTGATPFGNDRWNSFIEYMVQSEAFDKNDNTQSQNYSQKAFEEIRAWKEAMQDNGAFYICRKVDNGTVKRDRRTNLDDLYVGLYSIVGEIYPLAPELNYDLIDGVYLISYLKLGVKSAVNGKTEGLYNAAQPKKKLEEALKGAWNKPIEYRYWKEAPQMYISQIKKCVDEVIADEFDKCDRVAISTIYTKLTEAPYGFLPCNLTAFILGFILKDYIGNQYGYDDSITGGEMNLANLSAMIEWVIKYAAGQDTKYREKYIVTLTEEIRKFNELTCAAFSINAEQCTNIPNTRNYIRNRMKDLTFPVWCLDYYLNDISLVTSKEKVSKAIQLYAGIANNATMGQSESDIATAIGELYKENPTLMQDLPFLFVKKNCIAGMLNYLAGFNDGELLKLAVEIEDEDQYINEVKKKFDADSANWVWVKETADKKIGEVIVEYSIIAESNKLIGKAKNLRESLDGWKTKCGNIRVSYDASKNYLGDIEPLVKALYDLKRQGSLLDSQKVGFLRLLQEKGDLFDEYYKNQISLFSSVCDFYVNEFDAEEQGELFTTIPTGDTFTKDKPLYLQLVEKAAKEFKSTLGKDKLRNLWRQKTNTDSPEEWSKQNLTPIICMVKEEEYEKARQAFLTLSRQHPEGDETVKAMEYLKTASFYVDLSDKAKCDEAFNEKILKGYSALLSIDDVRSYLKERASAQPHDWYSNPMVDKLIKEFAIAKYDTEGSVLATSIVDKMKDISELKTYLKKLIQADISIGIGIIKANSKK